jgi:hypothetical protein
MCKTSIAALVIGSLLLIATPQVQAAAGRAPQAMVRPTPQAVFLKHPEPLTKAEKQQYSTAEEKAREKGVLDEKAGSLGSLFWTLVGLALLLLTLGVI